MFGLLKRAPLIRWRYVAWMSTPVGKRRNLRKPSPRPSQVDVKSPPPPLPPPHLLEQEKKKKWRKFQFNVFVQIFTAVINIFLIILIFFPEFGRACSRYPSKPHADSLTSSREFEEEDTSDEENEEEEKAKRPKKPRVKLRDRQVIAYENRIRTYSQPDKIFRLFATIRLVDNGADVVLMTPDDFIRSILPGRIQPNGLGLEQYTKMDQKHYQMLLGAESRHREGSFFGRVCQHGLVSLSDYLFLLTVLSTPRRNFEIAFRMLDMNGDGTIHKEEFERVSTVLAQSTAVGQQYRLIGQAGRAKSALGALFFGEDGKDVLTYQRFLDYLDQLNAEVLAMEFESYLPWDGRISELDVADCLLAYASSLPQPTRKQLRKRVKRAFGSWSKGITFEEFQQLAQFVASIGPAEWIFQFPPHPMTPEFILHTAKTAMGVEISEHLANILFQMFSEIENGDAVNFDSSIFFRVLQQRQNRGLERRSLSSFSSVLSAMWSCGIGHVKDSFQAVAQ